MNARNALCQGESRSFPGPRRWPEDGTARATARSMLQQKLSLYFKRLRMIHCREQQIIGILPDLVSEAKAPPLKEALTGYLASALCRRSMIKSLASDHGIPPQAGKCRGHSPNS